MKTLLTISTFVFIFMFSSPSFADWTKVTESVDGNTFYVDFERIRKVDGFVYYWELGDLLKPYSDGTLSYKVYTQGDCKLFRFKRLSGSSHKEPMGGGTGKDFPLSDKWTYPSPNSSMETILKSVCSR